MKYPLLCLLLLFLRPGTSEAQQPATPGAGLRAQYYDGKNFEKLVLTRIDKTIDFNWTMERNQAGQVVARFVSPGPGVPSEYFSVRWSGHLYAPVTGPYIFQITVDDGMRVWVGGQKILDEWRGQSATQYTARIRLEAGRYYPLRIEYYQADRDTRALVSWIRPDADDAQPIPAINLYADLPPTARPIPTAPALPAAPATAPKTVPPPAAKPRAAVAPAPVPRRPRPAAPPAPVRVAPSPAALPDTQRASIPDLSALSKGAAVTLPNLYFTQSTATLLPASRPILNELARTLRAQPTLRLEIAGHTDNVGDAALNLRLSEQRARVVRQYLVQQGIDSVRLTARGYGGTRPVVNNQDLQLRPRNRRVEVVVQ